jgi:uncharacterized membrane protein
MLLVLASVIGAGGVVEDSAPAVIGAMIVAPLATPIYGAALVTVIGSRRDLRTAVHLVAGGIVVSILAGVAIAISHQSGDEIVAIAMGPDDPPPLE